MPSTYYLIRGKLKVNFPDVSINKKNIYHIFYLFFIISNLHIVF
mgnify:CR=1 FL=1